MNSFEKAVELIEKSDIENLKKLIKENPSILKEIDRDSGVHLLFYTIEKKSIEMTRLLLDHGADVNSRDSSGGTPLHYAAKSGSVEIAELLIEHGADLNASDHGGWTALFIAVYTGNREVVKLLLDHGVNINKNEDENRLLFYASIGSIDIVRLLLEYGVDVNARDRYEMTILHIVLQYEGEKDSVDIAKLLIDHGADVNSVDRYGRSPLFYAVKTGNMNIVKYLILHGASPYLKDYDDKTALDSIEDSRLKNELLFLYRNREKILNEMNRQKDREIEYEQF